VTEEQPMRWKGVHHVEFSVLDYEASLAFYDRMFGWLGYKSFWTLDIGYRSTYIYGALSASAQLYRLPAGEDRR
jgi:catechol 2,3-dioxygenase-like lactoylglutathione lyase family enzyme